MPAAAIHIRLWPRSSRHAAACTLTILLRHVAHMTQALSQSPCRADRTVRLAAADLRCRLAATFLWRTSPATHASQVLHSAGAAEDVAMRVTAFGGATMSALLLHTSNTTVRPLAQALPRTQWKCVRKAPPQRRTWQSGWQRAAARTFSYMIYLFTSIQL